MTLHSIENERLERLIRDYRRSSTIFGISIISLALVISAIVWSIPQFQLFPSADTSAFVAASASQK